MQERIVLLTVRYEKKPAQAGKRPVEVLVQSASGLQPPWVPVTTTKAVGELPIEAAVRAGEAIFGDGSVSSLWLLGKTPAAASDHFYCLDTDSLGGDPSMSPAGHIWVALADVTAQFSGPARTLAEKIKAYEQG